MKSFLRLLTIFLTFSFIITESKAMTFTEGYSELSRRPLAVLIFAPWVENSESYINTFNSLQNRYNKKCNFATLNIADKETLFFNSKYNIYQNLPYVLFFKNERNVRFLDRNCISNTSCLIQRLDVFLQ